MIPQLVLAIADKAAAKEAIRNIMTKFLKEGFAKGVAAGVMGWTDAEVQSELKNHMNSTRVKGMEDPAGFLTRSDILQMAEGSENYGVDVGFLYSETKSNAWKEEMRSVGFAVLLQYRYGFPQDPESSLNMILLISWRSQSILKLTQL
jgi:hypothetical protein